MRCRPFPFVRAARYRACVTPEELEAVWALEPSGWRVCFWCEDRPATGYLVLVCAHTSKAVDRRRGLASRPAVCDICKWDCHDRTVTMPGDRPARWIYVAFRGA